MIEVVNMTWDELKNLSLNEPVEIAEIQACSKAVYGGVSWPGKRPGFAVVIAMDRTRHIDNYDVCILDECESFDTREVVRQCGALDLKYGIGMSRSYSGETFGRWIGDYKHDAASRFIQEMNDEYEKTRDYYETPKRDFRLTPTAILDMEHPYQYLLSETKELLHPERRMLFLKGSKIKAYMRDIEGEEIADLTFGDYPAVEALAFAVIEMRNHIKRKETIAQMPESNPYSGSIYDYTKRNRDVFG